MVAVVRGEAVWRLRRRSRRELLHAGSNPLELGLTQVELAQAGEADRLQGGEYLVEYIALN
jgi:hypothetical protein